MAIRYSVDSRSGWLLTCADGLVTFHDISSHLDHEQRNRDLDRPELVDARGAKTDVTPEEVRQLVRRASDLLRIVDLGPTAIVTSDDVAHGMANMYSVLAEGAGAAVEVFHDVESANRWLNSVDDGRH
jgi:hypothetical protein